MRQGGHHPADGIARSLGVRVESDHVADSLQIAGVANSQDVIYARVALAHEVAVHVFELASLALPAHPLAFTFGPFALAMEKEELPFAVTAVQLFDSVD